MLRVCLEVPCPPCDGLRLEPFHTTKGLARLGHEITLIGFQRAPSDISALESWCEVHAVSFRGRNSLRNLAAGALQRFPINYVKYRSEALLQRILGLLSRNAYDVLVVDYSAMGWYALQIRSRMPGLPIVTRWHNVDTRIWDRWCESQTNTVLLRLGRIQRGLVEAFERELALASDICLTAGAEDATFLRSMAPAGKVEYLPPGVDTERYTLQPTTTDRHVLFMASNYKWHPNVDAVRWLHNEIMPLVWARHPETVLFITGAGHTREMHQWAHDDRVVLTGFVPDERTIAERCRVLAVPMRMGGGIKLKILTAFAMGKAVVTTSRGVEGIASAADGAHCLVRDSAQDFADAVVELLDDTVLSEKLIGNARRLVCERHTWDQISRQFETHLESALSRHGQFGAVSSSVTVL